MTPFDFLAHAISVILGLAITRLISGIGISIRLIKSKKYFWLHGLWIINMLILIPAYWWGIYSWSSLGDWNLFHFLLLVIYTTNLYLITDFLVPEKFDSELNVKEYFMDNRKMFFGLLFLSLIIDIVETYLIVKEGLEICPGDFL